MVQILFLIYFPQMFLVQIENPKFPDEIWNFFRRFRYLAPILGVQTSHFLHKYPGASSVTSYQNHA